MYLNVNTNGKKKGGTLFKILFSLAYLYVNQITTRITKNRLSGYIEPIMLMKNFEQYKAKDRNIDWLEIRFRLFVILLNSLILVSCSASMMNDNA